MSGPIRLATPLGSKVIIDFNIDGSNPNGPKISGTLVDWTCKGINLMIARVRLDQDVPVVGQPEVIVWKAGYIMHCNPEWVSTIC